MTATPSATIRVMVVDDHAMVRRGLATFLRAFNDLELAGEADSGEAAIETCTVLRPDVILMDMMLPGVSGPEAIRVIRRLVPHAQIIALTSFKDGDLIRGALKSGAIGYLLKDIAADDLAQAIRSAHAGRGTLSPEATQSLVESSDEQPAVEYRLTEREATILDLMVEGLNNTQIAGRLGISPSTVKSHVSSILSKLGAQSRTEAVILALRQGLVS